jgi:hypothetical protein
VWVCIDYDQGKNKAFISLYESSGNCEPVPKPVSGEYYASIQGYWEGSVHYFEDLALYLFDCTLNAIVLGVSSVCVCSVCVCVCTHVCVLFVLMCVCAVTNMQVSTDQYREVLSAFAEHVNYTVGESFAQNNLAMNIAVLLSSVFSYKVCTAVCLLV